MRARTGEKHEKNLGIKPNAPKTKEMKLKSTEPFLPFFNIMTRFNISDTKMGSTSINSCSHTANCFCIAFAILLLNLLEYVEGTKYFAIDYLAIWRSFSKVLIS